MTSPDPPQGSGLRGPCPRWCARPHADDDDPEDLVHHSEGVTFAATVLDDAWPPRTQATQLVALASRSDSEPHAWIRVEDCEGRGSRLVVSLETAHRLLRVLGDVVAALDERDGPSGAD